MPNNTKIRIEATCAENALLFDDELMLSQMIQLLTLPELIHSLLGDRDEWCVSHFFHWSQIRQESVRIDSLHRTRHVEIQSETLPDTKHILLVTQLLNRQDFLAKGLDLGSL